jgi:hypothetical protein
MKEIFFYHKSFRFQIILFLLFSLCPLILSQSAFGATLNLTAVWNPNTNRDMKEYRLYRTDVSRTLIGTTPHPGTSYGPFPVTVPDGSSGTLVFKLTAVDTSNLESADSSPASYRYNPYTVSTNPSGLQIVVDEIANPTPYTFTWGVGSSHKLSVTSPQNGDPGVKYLFGSWSDGGSKTHTVTAPISGKTYTAKFAAKFSLTTSVSLPEGGTVSPSGTFWYKSGTNVSITATPRFGYRFSGWSGDYLGSEKSIILDMNGPKNVMANFETIPEEISVPTMPKGVPKGNTDTSYAFSTSSSSNLRHSLEYQFDWGDGSTPVWGPAKQSHIWTMAGTYQMRVMARCATHTSLVSGWSNIKSVTINGWLYTISGENGDEGGATLWFDQGIFDGYGVSYDFETFRIQGNYSSDRQGLMSGAFTLSDLRGVDLVSGTLTGSVNSVTTKMKLVLKDSNDFPVFNMAGVRLRGEQVIPRDWNATISGDVEGSFDSLTIEPYQDLTSGEVFSRVFHISGSGSITMTGDFFYTHVRKYAPNGNYKGNIVYGVYGMTGGITETGVISGTLNPNKGKFTFNLTSDNEENKYRLDGQERTP